MKKPVVSISGGGEKITFLLGVVVGIFTKVQRFNPSAFVGISAGAILAFLYGVTFKNERVRNQGIDLILGFKTSDILKEKDKSLWNRITLVYRVLFKSYLYDDSNLRDSLKSIISRRLFIDWQLTTGSPDIFIGVTHIDNQKGKKIEKYFNLKEVEYEDAIEIVMASTSIPPFVEAKVVNGVKYYDGGLQSHNGSEYILKQDTSITELHSIYSRTKEITSYDWSFPTNGFMKFSIVKIMKRVIDLLVLRISYDDEIITDAICRENNIKQHKYYTPRNIAEVSYEMNRKINKERFDLGFIEGSR